MPPEGEANGAAGTARLGGVDWKDDWGLFVAGGLTLFGRVIGEEDGLYTLSPSYEVLRMPSVDERGRIVAIADTLVLPRGVIGRAAEFEIAAEVVSYASSWEDGDRAKFAALVAQAEADRAAARAQRATIIAAQQAAAPAAR
jgi:hypothetical protein